MMAVEEDLDFSRYLVDSDDDVAGTSSATVLPAGVPSLSYRSANSTNGNEYGSSSSINRGSSSGPQHVRGSDHHNLMHSAKNWMSDFNGSTGMTVPPPVKASLSPSPPESGSNPSSTSTAPSSVITPSSFPLLFNNGFPSHNAGSGGNLASPGSYTQFENGQQYAQSPQHNTYSHPQHQQQQATFSPQLSLSFSYDFGNSNLSAQSPSVNPHNPSSGFSNGNGSHVQNSHSSSTLSSSATSLTSPMSFFPENGGLPPASGPVTHKGGHRSRQASVNALSNSTSPSTAQFSWLSMTPNTNGSSLSSSTIATAGKPYARPEAAASLSSASAHHSITADNKVGSNVLSTPGATAPHRKSSKRKSKSASNSISVPSTAFTAYAPLPEKLLSPTTKTKNHAAPQPTRQDVQQIQTNFSFPSSSQLAYRDPASALLSPITPATEGFATFPLPSTAVTSAVPSPQHSSAGSTPAEQALQVVNAPSPFDPRNFTNLDIDPLSPPSSTENDVPSRVDQAAALAGLGGKWFNFQGQEDEGTGSKAVVSNVLATDDLFPTSSLSASTSTVVNTDGKGTPGVSKSLVRGSSMAPEDPFLIDGDSPEVMAAKDPLATHLWRVYAKAKAGLPSGARMENITWRMMSLKLNKQRQQQQQQEQAQQAQAQAQAASEQRQAKIASRRSSDEKARPSASAHGAVDARLASKAVEAEECERGRRGRGTNSTASPKDLNEVVEEGMDWRNQSRSRSRPPAVGLMEWRAQSRSRSRAPNMRLSMPSTPTGFSFPSYSSSTVNGGSTHSKTNNDDEFRPMGDVAPAQLAATNAEAVSRSASTAGLPTFEETLRQLMASSQGSQPTTTTTTDPVASPSRKNAHVRAMSQSQQQPQQSSTRPSSPHKVIPNPTPLPSYVPPAPLPISPDAWLHPQPTFADLSASQASSYAPSSQGTSYQDQSSLLPPMPAPDGSDGNTSQSSAYPAGQALPPNLAAYFQGLNQANYGYDLSAFTANKHVGSVPGLFDEQSLKQNHHAEFGYVPRLVRKTSFDASFPASLAQQEQRQQQKRAQQSPEPFMSQSVVNTPYAAHHRASSYFKPQQVAQSTPGTPSTAFANIPFNFDNFAKAANVDVSTAMPVGGGMLSAEQQQQQAQSYAASQSAAIEAFRRLQAAQALQAAANMQGYLPFMDPSYLARPGFAEAIAAGMPLPPAHQQFDPSMSGMHVNPVQVLGGMQPLQHQHVPPISASQPGSPWSMSPPGMTPPSHTSGTSPEEPSQDQASAGFKAPNRNSTSVNMAQQVDFAHQQQQQPRPMKSHARRESATGVPASGDPPAPAVICINCKTTNTPLWRRDENGNPLCNACQLFRKLHGSDRPVSLHNSVVKKRNRTRNKTDGVPKKSASRSARRNSTTGTTKGGTGPSEDSSVA